MHLNKLFIKYLVATIFLFLESPIIMSVTRVSKANIISCLILDLAVCLLVLWNFFFQMLGDLPQHQSENMVIMLVLSMIIVNSYGSIFCVINLKFFNVFETFKILLKGNSTVKSGQFKRTGVENTNH